jgi:hypothetical protein
MIRTLRPRCGDFGQLISFTTKMRIWELALARDRAAAAAGDLTRDVAT